MTDSRPLRSARLGAPRGAPPKPARALAGNGPRNARCAAERADSGALAENTPPRIAQNRRSTPPEGVRGRAESGPRRRPLLRPLRLGWRFRNVRVRRPPNRRQYPGLHAVEPLAGSGSLLWPPEPLCVTVQTIWRIPKQPAADLKTPSRRDRWLQATPPVGDQGAGVNAHPPPNPHPALGPGGRLQHRPPSRATAARPAPDGGKDAFPVGGYPPTPMWIHVGSEP